MRSNSRHSMLLILKDCEDAAVDIVEKQISIYKYVIQDDVSNIWHFEETYMKIHGNLGTDKGFDFRKMKFTVFVERMTRFLKRYNKQYVLVMLEASTRQAVETVMVREVASRFRLLEKTLLERGEDKAGFIEFMLTESDSLACERARAEAEAKEHAQRKEALEKALKLIQANRMG
mmetsp:Transcript_17474/g.43933  ORF Transcript_17474/g.43933 Transcript_17474/m.43933 type:complete len:175 (-) Transcript_17474:231-755(-)